MSHAKVLKLYNLIDETSLSEEQLECKIIQIVDLIRFIEIYNDSILIKDFLKYNCSIISHENKSIGIVFCEQLEEIESLIATQKLLMIKDKEFLNELWIVFVKDSQQPISIENIKNDTKFNLFDKIFNFNFYKQTILQAR